MTIKQELIAVMERIAAEWKTTKVTVILCCEGEEQAPTVYGSINSRGNFTVLSVISSHEAILGIMDYAFNLANDIHHADHQ